MFENSKWISRAISEKDAPAPLLRKSFEVNKAVKKANLYVCGLGLGEYYINGEKVSDEVLITPYTKYDSTVIYSTFDVTKCLNAGKNAIGVILGNGCYYVNFPRWDVFKAPWTHHPKLILQLDIEFCDGSYSRITSDRTWKSYDSAILYNQTKRGETYDARLEINGWSKPEFDDSQWDECFICRSPGGVFRKMKHPPIRITEEFCAVNIHDNIYDLKQNISGWVKIRAKARRGHKIIIKYAECLKEDGRPDYDKLNTIVGSQTHSDTYIFKGDGIEEWAPRFAYHGFRYVEIINAPKDIEVIGQFVHTDVKQTGEFECSDDMLNKIHKMVRMSTLSNLHGIFTDCPQREQNGWTGDALFSLEQSLYNYDMSSLYSKWLQDIKDEQRPSGQIPAIAPTAGWGYNWGSGPAWDSFLIQCPFYVYKYTGSKAVIRKMWSSMKLYMKFMESMADNYIQKFGLGDWCAPENCETTPTEFTDTIFYYADAKIMSQCAVLIGDNGDYYENLAENIRTSFRERFVNNGIINIKTQTAFATGIYNDMLDDEEIPQNAKILNELIIENNYSTTCGIIGIKYIYSALSENGYAETAYKMTVNPKMPSYAYWVNSGMTTLCERWNMKDSLNHHMWSEVDTWFYKHLAGIHIVADDIVIKPLFLENLDYVKAHYKGIKVEWNRTEIKIEADRDFTLCINNHEKRYNKGIYLMDKSEL